MRKNKIILFSLLLLTMGNKTTVRADMAEGSEGGLISKAGKVAGKFLEIADRESSGMLEKNSTKVDSNLQQNEQEINKNIEVKVKNFNTMKKFFAPSFVDNLEKTIRDLSFGVFSHMVAKDSQKLVRLVGSSSGVATILQFVMQAVALPVDVVAGPVMDVIQSLRQELGIKNGAGLKDGNNLAGAKNIPISLNHMEKLQGKLGFDGLDFKALTKSLEEKNVEDVSKDAFSVTEAEARVLATRDMVSCFGNHITAEDPYHGIADDQLRAKFKDGWCDSFIGNNSGFFANNKNTLAALLNFKKLSADTRREEVVNMMKCFLQKFNSIETEQNKYTLEEGSPHIAAIFKGEMSQNIAEQMIQALMNSIQLEQPEAKDFLMLNFCVAITSLYSAKKDEANGKSMLRVREENNALIKNFCQMSAEQLGSTDMVGLANSMVKDASFLKGHAPVDIFSKTKTKTVTQSYSININGSNVVVNQYFSSIKTKFKNSIKNVANGRNNFNPRGVSYSDKQQAKQGFKENIESKFDKIFGSAPSEGGTNSGEKASMESQDNFDSWNTNNSEFAQSEGGRRNSFENLKGFNSFYTKEENPKSRSFETNQGPEQSEQPEPIQDSISEEDAKKFIKLLGGKIQLDNLNIVEGTIDSNTTLEMKVSTDVLDFTRVQKHRLLLQTHPDRFAHKPIVLKLKKKDGTHIKHANGKYVALNVEDFLRALIDLQV